MKRRSLYSPSAKDKVSKTENDKLFGCCCVSRLPDDIVVNIFSRLTLIEAARTSVVSRRWRYLWTFTANLDFQAPDTIWKIGEEPNEIAIEKKRCMYINWVEKVLELHGGKYINEFRIHFDLGDDQKTNITRWIHTALAKGLETLELHLDLKVDSIQFPLFELPKLRHLTFDVNANNGDSLLDLTRMIKACPFLCKFTLKLISEDSKRKLRQFPNCRHEHLKVVEFIGFIGRPIDLELAFYLLENSPVLEKMIVNPTHPLLIGSYFEFEDVKEKQDARKRAKRLQKRVPQGALLVIL
ncbi:hypothetical protein JRO89_XS13G0181500 [Xanthoceras sorbifolium]|uniref:F-box domain-containing protein n=1 Tax=Xanthoceras sorbifolium TaxID=99658 RepID=A0ABQ8H8Z7_9ROSI|nr:hypothetical protein JRO89_XS13G0181500 [Xanthoceras sorbifolium]